MGLARFGPLVGTAIGTGLLTLLLFIALFFPGVYASIRWMLVSPIVVAENADDPRQRSSFLTEGHRGELFGMLALLWGGLVIVAVLLAVVLPDEDTVLGNAVILVPSAVFISFRAVLEGVTYSLLRSEKEGVDLEQLTAVFR